MSTGGVRARILIVEDEPAVATPVADRLRSGGAEVVAVGDGESGIERVESARWDLLILDVMLPGIDGFEVCRRLRARGHRLPILMLTARGETVDTVVGLRLGADDYLKKPFDMAELEARVSALLRRGRRGAGDDSYAFGDVRVDLRRAEVTVGDKPVELTPLEYRLLTTFIAHRGEVLSRDRLLDEVWGYDATPMTRTVDVHVASLRSKIEGNPAQPRFVVTVHRLGYRFDG